MYDTVSNLKCDESRCNSNKTQCSWTSESLLGYVDCPIIKMQEMEDTHTQLKLFRPFTINEYFGGETEGKKNSNCWRC